MAPNDRFSESDHSSDRPPRQFSTKFLLDASTWFATAVVGMVIVFVGLGVDAYRHNHSAAEESLLSMSNPGHLLAAIGLGITAIAVLAGLTVAMLRGVEDREALLRRFAGVGAA